MTHCGVLLPPCLPDDQKLVRSQVISLPIVRGVQWVKQLCRRQSSRHEEAPLETLIKATQFSLEAPRKLVASFVSAAIILNGLQARLRVQESVTYEQIVTEKEIMPH